MNTIQPTIYQHTYPPLKHYSPNHRPTYCSTDRSSIDTPTHQLNTIHATIVRRTDPTHDLYSLFHLPIIDQHIDPPPEQYSPRPSKFRLWCLATRQTPLDSCFSNCTEQESSPMRHRVPPLALVVTRLVLVILDRPICFQISSDMMVISEAVSSCSRAGILLMSNRTYLSSVVASLLNVAYATFKQDTSEQPVFLGAFAWSTSFWAW